MPTNFPTQTGPVQTSQYKPKGLDYWLYGPQLQAKARGLGMQIAGSMRNDITGIHENDIDHIKTLTGRIGRKRDEYIDKIMDGADVNDQFVKSLSKTFRENKSIQGSIVEAKKNNEKIEAYKQAALEYGMKSGDHQYYRQWMNDSLEAWGSTFKGGQVNPFEMAPVADYENIIEDFQVVIDDVEKFMTPEQVAGRGVDWSVNPQEVKDAKGNVIGTQLVIRENKPGLFHSNKDRIQEELDKFQSRFNRSEDPEKRGQYADFLEFRTREDDSYMPILQREMQDIARRSTWEYTDPDEQSVKSGSFVRAVTPSVVPSGRENVHIGTPIINQSSNIPSRPLKREGSLSSNTDFVLDVSADADGNFDAVYSSTSKEAAEANLQNKVDGLTQDMQTMVGDTRFTTLLKDMTAAEYNGSNPFVKWMNRVLKGEGSQRDKLAAEEIRDELVDMPYNYIDFNKQDVLAVKASSAEVKPKEGQTPPNAAALQAMYVGKKMSMNNLTGKGKARADLAKSKFDLYQKFAGLYDNYRKLDPAVDSRSRVVITKPSELRVEYGRIADNMNSQPYSVFKFNPDDDSYQELGNSFTVADKWEKIYGIDFSTIEGTAALEAAMQNPGVKQQGSGITVSKDFEVTSQVSDWSDKVSQEVWDTLDPNQKAILKDSYKNGDMLHIRIADPSGKGKDAHVRMLVGTSAAGNPNAHPIDDRRNTAEFSEWSKEEGNFVKYRANPQEIIDSLEEPGSTQEIMLGSEASGYAIRVEKIGGGPNAYRFESVGGNPISNVDTETHTSTDLAMMKQFIANLNLQVLQSNTQE